MESINYAFYTKILSISERQAIIKLTETKDHNKQYIKKWRPISFLNVDKKISSKAISKKLKAVFANVNFLAINCLCE